METATQPVERLSLSFRISGDNLDHGLITKMLKLSPSILGIRGEHIGNKPERAKYETHLWVYNFPEKFDSLPQAIATFFDRIHPASADLADELAQSELQADLFIAYFGNGSGQGGLLLSHSDMSRLAALKIDLHFDLYV